MHRNALKGLTGGPAEPIAEAESKKQEKTEVRFTRIDSQQGLITYQVDEIVEKIYANMSACHLKNENWQRALECANKVGSITQSILLLLIAITPGPIQKREQLQGYVPSRQGAGRAWFLREGGEGAGGPEDKGPLGFVPFPRSLSPIFLIVNYTDAPGVTAELARLRAIDQAREKAHKQKLKGLHRFTVSLGDSSTCPCLGFLSREKPEKKTASVSGSGVEEIMSPGVTAANKA